MSRYKIDVFIEYKPETYQYPYRLVWYTSENDTLGTDLGGFSTYAEALIGLRKFLIVYGHLPPYKVDILLTERYGEVYEKALRRWRSRVLGEVE